MNAPRAARASAAGPDQRLLWVLGAAAVLRLLLLTQNASSHPLGDTPVIDAALHHAAAARIAAGEGAGNGPFERPPLYAYALACAQAVVGPSPLWAAAVQAAGGLLGCWLLARLARLWLTEPHALLAAGLAALYGPLAFFELKLLPASLSVGLTLAFLNVLLAPPRWLDGPTPGPRGAFVAGLLGGALVLCRPNLAALPVLAAAWAWAARLGGTRRAGLALAAGLALGVAPATLHNAAQGDGSVLVSSGTGLNLWLGNRRGAEVSFTGAFPGVEDAGSLHQTSLRLHAQATGRPAGAGPPRAAEVDAFWLQRAASEVVADPGAWLGLQARKLAASLSRFEYGMNASYAAERAVLSTLWLFVLPSWLLFALGLPGLVWLARTEDVRHGPRPSVVPLLLVPVAVLVSAALFFTYTRFRLPATPVLAIGSAATLMILVRAARARRGRELLWRLGVVGAVAGVTLLPPDPVARRQLGAGHALVGSAALWHGDMVGARAAYERAVAADPDDALAHETLAQLLASADDLAGAATHHERALRAAPDDPRVQAQVALFRVTAPPPWFDARSAADLAARALAREASLLHAWLALGLAQQLEGRDEEADRAFEQALRLAGDDPNVRAAVADAYREAGRDDAAAAVAAGRPPAPQDGAGSRR